MSLTPRPNSSLKSPALLVLLPLLLACSSALASPSPRDPDGARPPMGGREVPPALRQRAEWLLSADALRELTLFEVGVELYRAFPAETSEILRTLVKQLSENVGGRVGQQAGKDGAGAMGVEDGAMEQSDGGIKQGDETLDETVFAPDWLDTIRDILDRFGLSLRDVTPCIACRGIIIYMRRFTDDEDHFTQGITEPLIGACEALYTGLLGRKGDVLCRSTLEIQMPHVYEVVREQVPLIRPDQICTFLNLCFPDPSTTSPAKRSPLPADKPSNSQSDTRDVGRRAEGSRRGGSDPEGILEEAIKVVQLTDIHIEPEYMEDASTDCGLPVCCMPAYNGTGNAGPLGDYNCNIPRRTMEIFLAKVASLNPDIVLFSGDIPPHSVWDETLASQRECSQLLVDAIKANLSGHHVYPNIGNHEMYPTNLYSMVKNATSKTSDFAAWHADLWTEVANFSQEQITSMRAGGYYSLLLRDGLRLISFNSNYMYTFNWYNVHNHRNLSLPARPGEYSVMHEFMQKALADAKLAEEKVILMGHHPPGGSDYLIEGSRWYRNLVLQYSDIIVLQPSGHTHYDEMRIIYDNAGEPRSVVLVSPSMTTMGTRNPSMRVFYLDAEDKHLIDYEQHFMDLDPGRFAERQAVDWSNLIIPLYSARKEYGLDDLSPASWENLLTRFENDTELLTLHRSHSQANAQSELGRCWGRCQTAHICRQRNVNFDEYRACLPPLRPTLPPRPTLPTGSARPTLSFNLTLPTRPTQRPPSINWSAVPPRGCAALVSGAFALLHILHAARP